MHGYRGNEGDEAALFLAQTKNALNDALSRRDFARVANLAGSLRRRGESEVDHITMLEGVHDEGVALLSEANEHAKKHGRTEYGDGLFMRSNEAFELCAGFSMNQLQMRADTAYSVLLHTRSFRLAVKSYLGMAAMYASMYFPRVDPARAMKLIRQAEKLYEQHDPNDPISLLDTHITRGEMYYDISKLGNGPLDKALRSPAMDAWASAWIMQKEIDPKVVQKGLIPGVSILSVMRQTEIKFGIVEARLAAVSDDRRVKEDWLKRALERLGGTGIPEEGEVLQLAAEMDHKTYGGLYDAYGKRMTHTNGDSNGAVSPGQTGTPRDNDNSPD